MTRTELQKYETTLQSLREELLESLRTREEIHIEREADALDDLTQSSARDFAVAGIERKNHKVKQLDEALQRMEAETYGVCENCEEDIPLKRLNAVPWAFLCVRCQEQSDNEQASTRPYSMYSDREEIEAAA